jgi:hypothetical protein
MPRMRPSSLRGASATPVARMERKRNAGSRISLPLHPGYTLWASQHAQAAIHAMPDETKNVTHIREMVRAQLDGMAGIELKRELSEYIIEPYREMRKWDYSLSGEQFPVWIVARFPGYDLGLAYSEFGHGARGDHWGIVQLSDNHFGRDDSWFLRASAVQSPMITRFRRVHRIHGADWATRSVIARSASDEAIQRLAPRP